MRAVRLVLCSENAHKLRELRAAVPGFDVEALDATGYPDETGGSYEDNARIKARFGRPRAPADAWVLGEDAGIEVEALGWRPGPRSARWSERPIEELLEKLRGVTGRRARYRCAIVAIGPDGAEHAVEGALDGRVAEEPRGSAGFGYDPVFIPEGETRTVAELGDAWKSRHSHRARAALALRAALAAG